MNILVMKFRSIGDVLLSTALIRNIKLEYPDAQIQVAVNPESADILAQNPDVARVHALPRACSGPAKWSAQVRFARQLLAQPYDMLFSLTEGDRPALLARLSGAPMRLGYRSTNRMIRALRPYNRELHTRNDQKHCVLADMELLELAGIPIRDLRTRAFWSEDDECRVEELMAPLDSRPFVAIHPVARWRFKSWNAPGFAQVIDGLHDRGYAVVLTGGTSQRERQEIAEIHAAAGTSPLDLSGRTSLSQLACLLSQARAYVGVDTASMHIAAAVDTPVIALFGSTDRRIWHPWDGEVMPAQALGQNCTAPAWRYGAHVVIQYPDDEICFVDGRKISTAMQRIQPMNVLGAFDALMKETQNADRL